MARIVFDLDGTLIDSERDICGVANSLLADRGEAPITLGQTRDFVGNGPSVFIEKMRSARSIPDADHEGLLRGFLAAYDDAVTLTVLFPGVAKALECLTANGHRLGICTNKPIKPCMAVLRHLAIDQYFESIVGGDSLPVHKPNPAPLLAAVQQLEGGGQIYVGDSEVDAATAIAANVPFFLFTEGYRKKSIEELPHDHAFSHFDTLPNLIEAATIST